MMKEKIGYPDYILNATALNIEYNNIRLNQTVFLGKLKVYLCPWKLNLITIKWFLELYCTYKIIVAAAPLTSRGSILEGIWNDR